MGGFQSLIINIFLRFIAILSVLIINPRNFINIILNLFFLYLPAALFFIINIGFFLYIIYAPIDLLNILGYYLYRPYRNHPGN